MGRLLHVVLLQAPATKNANVHTNLATNAERYDDFNNSLPSKPSRCFTSLNPCPKHGKGWIPKEQYRSCSRSVVVHTHAN